MLPYTAAVAEGERRALLVDAGLAGGLFVLAVVALFGASGETSAVRANGGLIQATPLGVAVVFLGLLPVAVRRVWPFTALLVANVVYAITAITDELDRLPLLVGVLLCTYSFTAVAEGERRRIGAAVVAAGAAVSVTVGLRWHRDDWLSWTRDGGLEVVGFVAAWVLGTAAGRRDAAKRTLAKRASLAEDHAIEATTRERARIARELHDLVGHAISVISVQATVGEHLAETDPGQARTALATIHEMSQQAMVEMRRLVGVLRETDESGPALMPQPGLSDIPALLAEAERGGTVVALVTTGDGVTLTAGVGLAAYRVIQESLTNARKHAPGADVTVTVDYGKDELHIGIANRLADREAESRAGAEHERDGSGFGLIAMRERVAVYHGSLEAGPEPDGTFHVRARVPYVDALGDGRMSS